MGTATASATYAGGTNWLTSTGSSTFQILYVQSGCFSSPLTTSPPPRNVTVRKGSNLPVKCTLLTSTGAPVTNATGSLTVEDRGTGPILTSVAPFMTVPSNLAFKQDANKNYAYGLDTSPSAFIAGRYYLVTAHWNDGSKSSGWFIVK